MTRFLFICTIGPVQTFIAQARRTHDLYAGSQLITQLIYHAISYLCSTHESNEIVLPAINPRSDASAAELAIPNEFIAIIWSDNPRELGEKLTKEVQERFRNIVKDILVENELTVKGNCLEKQIKSFPEVYWAAVPFGEDDDYSERFQQLTRLLGAVKNTRMFEQLSETGRKCSLCGERNALFYRPILDKNNIERRPKFLADNAIHVRDHRMTQGEGLCGICWTKRYYNPLEMQQKFKKGFPSTAKIALSYAWNRLQQAPEFARLEGEYRKLLGSDFEDDIYTELFFEENLTESYFNKYGIDTDKYLTRLKELNCELLQSIAKSNENQSSLRLSRYYAILTFDADNMGKRLAGEGLKAGISLQAFHQALSKRLSDFDETAKAYLVEEKGQRIYAGGDDFLGLVNLRYLFPVMGKLRCMFDEMVHTPLKKEYLNSGNNLTFSAGAVVAHYKPPLRVALHWAREMLELAKNSSKEKDAFAVAVLKRSGEVENAVCRWQMDGASATQVLEDCVRLLDEGEFSNAFIQQLVREMRSLMDEKGTICAKNSYLEEKMLQAEIKRLLCRSYQFQQSQSKQGERLSRKLSDLYLEAMIDDANKTKNFLSLLAILDFLERRW